MYFANCSSEGPHVSLSPLKGEKERRILHYGDCYEKQWMTVPGAPGWAQSMKHPTLDFSSGHEPTVRGFEPRAWLCNDSVEPA